MDDKQTMIHTIDKNSVEQIRCSLCRYKGHPYLDLRTWSHDEGQWKPSKKGFTLPVNLVDELATAAEKLQVALDEQPKQRTLKAAS